VARWSRLRRAVHGDRGSVSAELVIATPLLLLLLLTIVQFALWSHATHIAQAAAAQGLAAARVQDATAAQGSVAARHVLDQLGRGPLTRIETASALRAASMRVWVSGPRPSWSSTCRAATLP
jgi:Flp pilus assembly protein TadG